MIKTHLWVASLLAVTIIASGGSCNSATTGTVHNQFKHVKVKKETRITQHHVLGTDYKHKLVEKYCNQYGVDITLAKAIIHTESGWNHKARSSHGAVGMMQLMPSTARAMKENPYTIDGNIRGGVKYIAYLQKRFGKNENLLIAAYNAGEGNVARYKGIPPFKQTRAYVRKVNENKAYY